MEIPRRTIDDFKNERKGILPALPAITRLVPMLFYLTAGATLIFSTLFLVHLNILRANIDVYNTGIAEAQAQIAATTTARQQLETRILEATDVQAWVEGSRQIQPLVVSVSRSIGEKANLADLKIERDEQSPSSLSLMMVLGASGEVAREQLDQTTAAIAQNYRLVQPQQTFAQGEVNYRVTLVTPTRATSDEPEIGNQPPQPNP